MDITISEACRLLEARGVLRRQPGDPSDGMVQQVRELLGGQMPADLEALYRERMKSVGDFAAILPKWNARPGWRQEGALRSLLHAQAVPIFSDGNGSLYGLDLSSGSQRPAVYFFDHEDLFERPRWAAGSSLPAAARPARSGHQREPFRRLGAVHRSRPRQMSQSPADLARRLACLH